MNILTLKQRESVIQAEEQRVLDVLPDIRKIAQHLQTQLLLKQNQRSQVKVALFTEINKISWKNDHTVYHVLFRIAHGPSVNFEWTNIVSGEVSSNMFNTEKIHQLAIQRYHQVLDNYPYLAYTITQQGDTRNEYILYPE